MHARLLLAILVTVTSACSAQDKGAPDTLPPDSGVSLPACTLTKLRLQNQDGKLIRFSAAKTMKRATKKVEWVIPALVRAARIQGTVVLEVFVGPTGEVECVSVISGHPMLVGAVVDAVRQWKFLPAKQDGKPVSYSGTLTFSWGKSMSLLNQ